MVLFLNFFSFLQISNIWYDICIYPEVIVKQVCLATITNLMVNKGIINSTYSLTYFHFVLLYVLLLLDVIYYRDNKLLAMYYDGFEEAPAHNTRYPQVECVMNRPYFESIILHMPRVCYHYSKIIII